MLVDNVETLSEEDLAHIRSVVYRHCGINLHSGKNGLVAARLAKRIRAGGFASASEYLEQALADSTGREFTFLIDALSTNLTGFFREKNHFDYLRDKVIPQLLVRNKESCRIRAWSAGCSSGEEAYSLAMVLHSVMDQPQPWDVKILATDISTRMLHTARRGAYAAEQLQAVPEELHQHFNVTRVDGQSMRHVSHAVRNMVCFRYLNLMDHWPFNGTFDFIFCRNVMIYFDKPTQQRLIQRLWDRLDSGGLLFTGHSESLTGVSHHFRYVQPTIYAKP